jgi:C4-dicarboxylate transporter DctM subunit
MTSALLLVGLVLALLFLRQPLVVTLMAVAAFVQIAWGKGQLDYILEDMWVALDKELILSIPLFILCGNVMTRGSTARRLIRIVASFTRVLPGGMGVATVLSCGVFAAISGSSIVTMLAIGTVMVPAMMAAGYERKFALGTAMSAGTLGIVIPPSIPMIVYGPGDRSLHHRPVPGWCRPRAVHPGGDVGLLHVGVPPHAHAAFRTR